MHDWTANVQSMKNAEIHYSKNQRRVAESLTRSNGQHCCPPASAGAGEQHLSCQRCCGLLGSSRQHEGNRCPQESPLLWHHRSLGSFFATAWSGQKDAQGLYKPVFSARIEVRAAHNLSQSGPKSSWHPIFYSSKQERMIKNWHKAERQLKGFSAAVSVIDHKWSSLLSKDPREVWCFSSDLVNYHQVHKNQKFPSGKSDDRKGQQCLYKWH